MKIEFSTGTIVLNSELSKYFTLTTMIQILGSESHLVYIIGGKRFYHIKLYHVKT